MPRFILVRHGETESNVRKVLLGWHDSPLTAQGREQAQATAATLPDSIDMIMSSDLGRARQTADYVLEHFSNTPILYDWRLRERCFGELENNPINPEEIDKSFVDKFTSYRGAEPLAHMNERIKSFIRDCALFDAETILLVTHSGVLNRFGYLFLENHTHQTYPNGTALEFTINYDDPRLLLVTCPAWIPVTP